LQVYVAISPFPFGSSSPPKPLHKRAYVVFKLGTDAVIEDLELFVSKEIDSTSGKSLVLLANSITLGQVVRAADIKYIEFSSGGYCRT